MGPLAKRPRRPLLPRRPWHNDYDVLIIAPNDRVDRILAASAMRCTSSAVLERAVLLLGTDRSSACVAAPTSRTFHCRDDRTFEQDVGADCSNSCVARYSSIISRVAQSSAVPFRKWSRVRAVNYAVDGVDAVFNHTLMSVLLLQRFIA